ncbi:hypothetical protein BSTEL_0532 [Bifidobacterium stellenboschense]|uniref:Uncharacterized protein n=2 Tax=Bifidobacterium stellenboschense TaxID=762211 RepID=A0A087DJM6_9BIFI|nr:hypothetical protein BSTEL_0532 [Bifidobacterium stellenboschense]
MLVMLIFMLIGYLIPSNDDDAFFKDMAARDKARHDARRASAAAYREAQAAQRRAQDRAARQAAHRAMVDAHNANVQAARQNPNSSYADRSYWFY